MLTKYNNSCNLKTTEAKSEVKQKGKTDKFSLEACNNKIRLTNKADQDRSDQLIK